MPINPDYWKKRWNDSQIGWHADETNKRLTEHWPSLGIEAGARVIAPLCGKSLDLHHLASFGHSVSGVEVSPVACEAFFNEAKLAFDVRPFGAALLYTSERIDLYCGDVFASWVGDLPLFDAFYDRAALIALDADGRAKYARWIATALKPGASGLVLTIEYPNAEKNGPPFSVRADEITALYQESFEIEELHREEIIDRDPKYRAWGLSSLKECVYRLRRR